MRRPSSDEHPATTYRYRPDFVVRLTNGRIALLEGKGDADEKDDAKATAPPRWVEAVNTWGGLGDWTHEICDDDTTLATQLNDASAAVGTSLAVL